MNGENLQAQLADYGRKIDELRFRLDDFHELLNGLAAGSADEATERVRELLAERDRLRTVANAARAYVAARSHWYAESAHVGLPAVEFTREYDDAHAALVDAVAQLDESEGAT